MRETLGSQCVKRWVPSNRIYGIKASFLWNESVEMLWKINVFFMENKKSQASGISANLAADAAV